VACRRHAVLRDLPANVFIGPNPSNPYQIVAYPAGTIFSGMIGDVLLSNEFDGDFVITPGPSVGGFDNRALAPTYAQLAPLQPRQPS
jgi:hypothetical protein